MSPTNIKKNTVKTQKPLPDIKNNSVKSTMNSNAKEHTDYEKGSSRRRQPFSSTPT